MAIGASSRAILILLLGRSPVMVLAGVVVGLLGAVVLTRALQSLLFGVSTNDPLVYISLAATLGTVAMLAAWIPARRATRSEGHGAPTGVSLGRGYRGTRSRGHAVSVYLDGRLLPAVASARAPIVPIL
jgi:hypothetical protein